jgi:hypothetical protein
MKIQLIEKIICYKKFFDLNFLVMKQQYFKLFFYDCPLKTSQVNLIQLGGIMDRDVNRNKI